MKKAFGLLFLLFALALTIIYRQDIQTYITDNFIYKKEISSPINNQYAVNYTYNFVSLTNDFSAKNKQQLLNIFYTYLNSGADSFYFYCDYDECANDINELTKDKTFSNINNFVSPFNTYNQVHFSISSWGKVEITVDKAYSENEITAVNAKLDDIMSKIITSKMSDKEKIKTFHDYVINHTKYDSEYADKDINDLTYYAHRATGALIYSKALCGGYSHTMSLFLNRLNIPNYRVASSSHIWNLVYLDGKWYHLDLTWDDPVTDDNEDHLLDSYFLISYEKLKNANIDHHDFDETIYVEAITIY